MGDHKKINVLLVDDDVNLVETTADILTNLGYRCAICHNGREGLEELKKNPYDVVLSDIKMPEMNGVEMVREIKKIKPNLPIIIMTAFRGEALIQEAVDEGVYDCVPKPLDMEHVLGLIERSQKEKASIMIVDDDANMCETIKDNLEMEGYVMTTVATREEAIEISKKRHQDIYFIDASLKSHNGLEVYLMLKEINSDAVYIIMTAHRKEIHGMLYEALEKGVYTIFYKPFEISEILRLIEKIVKKVGDKT